MNADYTFKLDDKFAGKFAEKKLNQSWVINDDINSLLYNVNNDLESFVDDWAAA